MRRQLGFDILATSPPRGSAATRRVREPGTAWKPGCSTPVFTKEAEVAGDPA
jgi:hypothetical protein